MNRQLRRLEEVKELQALIGYDSYKDNRKFWVSEMSNAIGELQTEFDHRLEQQNERMQSYYQMKVQEVRTGEAKDASKVEHLVTGTRRLQSIINDMRNQISDLEGRNSNLERRYADSMLRQHEDEMRVWDEEKNRYEAYIHRLTAECEKLLQERWSLLWRASYLWSLRSLPTGSCLRLRRTGKETEVVKQMYEAELKKVTDLYNGSGKEKAGVELECQSLEDQLADYKRRFCYTCECNSPPRSWHCHICNRCIMRRDHHCTFTGVCVGHRNYRYFLMLLLYLSVCGTYINVLNAEYAYDVLGGFNFQSLLAMLLPWAAWLTGMHGPFTFVVAFMSSLTLFWTLLTMGYLVYQLNLVSQGRTSFEINNKQGVEYNVGRLANIKQVLGKNWKICWLFPWIPSHLYTDGTRFPTNFNFEEVKDL